MILWSGKVFMFSIAQYYDMQVQMPQRKLAGRGRQHLLCSFLGSDGILVTTIQLVTQRYTFSNQAIKPSLTFWLLLESTSVETGTPNEPCWPMDKGWFWDAKNADLEGVVLEMPKISKCVMISEKFLRGGLFRYIFLVKFICCVGFWLGWTNTADLPIPSWIYSTVCSMSAIA